MHIHHAVRGGLLAMGVGIGAMIVLTTPGAGSPGAPAAPAAERAVVVAVPDAVGSPAPLPLAPAATPVLIEVVVEAAPAEEAEPVPDPAPEYPVVHAGPGPATPVEGATTLIDPLVIERDLEADPLD